ncbi:CorA family divalent cation transporter [Novosphingobium aerophilum]|uniref:CorA family divalent cation transporter n=1 Tax=Novosphingobium TaxID=165696 RepID=UPI0006C884E0|nr:MULTISPECIES: CorA family divalent cation transporter [unclassified Novosphingobium]KPH59211.1 magnesium transporter [Novosphingobium sp. ST904]TCM37698.1 zinc transporter [Novosphingobium sp. ST904]WRT93447.1 CorA family divalent cation transporter [Novosphingobium sp. RL4]
MKEEVLNDDSGAHLPLLFGRVLDGEGGGRPIDWDEVQRWHPTAAEPVLWIHLLRTHLGVQEWLEDWLELTEPTAELLTSDATRPRAFREGHSLVATLRGINFNPGAEPEDMVSMQLWSDGVRVVTLRRLPLQTPRIVCNEIDSGMGPNDAGALVTALTEHMIDRMSHSIIDMNDMIDELEDETIGNDTGEMLDKIVAVRRNCLALKRHMSPQHEALTSIANSAPAWFEEHDRREIAETIARLRRHLDDLDISKESAVVLQDDIRARAAANTQKTQYLLTIVAGIFLPLSFITGLLGINVGDIPLAAPGSHGFWIIVLMCLCIFAAEIMVARRLKWL